MVLKGALEGPLIAPLYDVERQPFSSRAEMLIFLSECLHGDHTARPCAIYGDIYGVIYDNKYQGQIGPITSAQSVRSSY